MKLLSIEADAKTIKGAKFGYLTGIQYLKPSFKVCPHATKGCMAACLNTAGRGSMGNVQDSRYKKTVFALTKPSEHKIQLEKEIIALIKKATKNGKKAAVRLNGTSDVNWENRVGDLLQKYSKQVKFYDYTKDVQKALAHHGKPIHYTVSFHENMEIDTVKELTSKGINVAVVFRDSNLPKTWHGIKVVDGDKHDIRFIDKKGCIVGLKAKGKAKKDTSGFVVDIVNG